MTILEKIMLVGLINLLLNGTCIAYLALTYASKSCGG